MEESSMLDLDEFQSWTLWWILQTKAEYIVVLTTKFESRSSFRTWCSSERVRTMKLYCVDNISDMIQTEELRFHQVTKTIQRHANSFGMSDA